MSITSALVARRADIQNKRLNNKEDGFTLIELLVVVIIIGILAAIAIPIYIGVTNGAKDTASQSDLTNAKTAVVAYYTQNTSFPTLNATTLGSFGYTGSSVSNASSGTATIDAFCLKSTSASGNVFYITNSTVVSAANTKPAGCS